MFNLFSVTFLSSLLLSQFDISTLTFEPINELAEAWPRSTGASALKWGVAKEKRKNKSFSPFAFQAICQVFAPVDY